MPLIVVSLLGAALFAWPLLGLAAPPDLPAVAAICVGLILLGSVEYGARRLDSRGLALLAVIAAVDAALRMAMVNGIAGFSPVFLLILCAGYTFGPTYGFLTGSVALLASALLTGGLGVWLPYEMLGCGWCGALAGFAGMQRHDGPVDRLDIAVLAVVGLASGIAYGILLDIWDWSLLRDSPGIGWIPGLSPADEIGRFFHFYVLTSVGWDLFRGVGNVILIVTIGRPVLMAFGRLRRRFGVVIEPTVADVSEAA